MLNKMSKISTRYFLDIWRIAKIFIQFIFRKIEWENFLSVTKTTLFVNNFFTKIGRFFILKCVMTFSWKLMQVMVTPLCYESINLIVENRIFSAPRAGLIVLSFFLLSYSINAVYPPLMFFWLSYTISCMILQQPPVFCFSVWLSS